MKTVEAIPKTDSIQELAQFWDTHDLTDFEDQLEEVTARVFERQTERRQRLRTSTFTEGFEIVVSTMDEDAYDWEKEEYRPQYLELLATHLTELGVSRNQLQFERTGVGVGSEGDAISLIVLTGLTILAAGREFFLSGKTINENVEGWIELAKKIRQVLNKLKADYVSQPFAAALALEEVIKKDSGATKFELSDALIDVVPNSSMDMTGRSAEEGRTIQEVFRYQQMRYYTFVVRAFDDRQAEGYWAQVPSTVHLICVRSTGKIEFHHVLPVRDWVWFERTEDKTPEAEK